MLNAVLRVHIELLTSKYVLHMSCFQFSKSVSLFRLPNPRPGEVLGLVGTNGIGKSTALKILAGKQKPNLGKFTVSSPLNDWITCTEKTANRSTE